MQIKEDFKSIKHYYEYTLKANKILLENVPKEDIKHIKDRIKVCKNMLKQIEWELKVLGIAEEERWNETKEEGL